MTERFDLNQTPEPVPPAAEHADPLQAMRSLYGRIACLERALEREREQREQEGQEAAEITQELLRTVLEMHDYMAETVERFGVITSAQESALVRRTVDFARLIREALARQEIEPIETLGKPVDKATSEVEDVVANDSVPPGTVLREVQVGYRWPLGLIRPARVIVAAPEADEPPKDDSDDESFTSTAQES